MQFLQKQRENKNLSQRRLAELAKLSFRTIQLAEWGKLNVTLSTLESIAQALGYKPQLVEAFVNQLFKYPPESVFITSHQILLEGEKSWKIHFFNFIDAFRQAKLKQDYIYFPPCEDLYPKIKALFASSVETLCVEENVEIPDWCAAIKALEFPWFISETENLKAMALVESPALFRKRNLFVLENFLSRA